MENIVDTFDGYG